MFPFFLNVEETELFLAVASRTLSFKKPMSQIIPRRLSVNELTNMEKENYTKTIPEDVFPDSLNDNLEA